MPAPRSASNDAAGHAGPLGTSSCNRSSALPRQGDNSAGAARRSTSTWTQGQVVLPVTARVITDVGLPVYATDDDTFAFSPVSGYFVGYVHRFVSAGVAIVAFDADWQDPYAGWTHALKSANYTVDGADDGKWIWVDTDAVVITLPAVDGIMRPRRQPRRLWRVRRCDQPGRGRSDHRPGITAADNKDLINTKATAHAAATLAEISIGDADGWMVSRCAAPGRAKLNRLD
jgi:hypothetical protein